MRVVVVGVGLAGLSAALDLQARGVEVVVLEGGRRAGGRVRTVRAPFRAGQLAESGAEWVDSHHGLMLELVARYGLRLEGEGIRWTILRRWVHINGELLGAAEADRRYDVVAALEAFDEQAERCADGIVDPARPLDHPDAVAIDARSAADVIDRLDPHPIARLLIERSMQGEFAAEPRQVSLLFLAQQRAVQRRATESVVAHRVVGGLDQLTSAMAREVHDLRLAGEVVTVERGGRSVTVRTATGAAVEADHAVLTPSLVALRAVRFEPSLPPRLAAAIAELGYGTVTKTALQYPGRPWPAGYLTSDTAFQRSYEPTVDQDGREGILVSYRGGDDARSWTRGEVERRREVDGLWRALFPELGEEPSGGFSRAWHEHPRYGGAYAVYRPGQVAAFWAVLRERHHRLWLAGEHTATVTGYMEGAVESGRRVATSILAVE